MPLPALAALGLALALAPVAQAQVTPKIVNGSDAAITDFPYQVALFNPSGGDPTFSQYCGGVILNSTHVVTAAHCLYDVFSPGQVSDPSKVSVLAGTDDLSATTGPDVKEIPAATVSFEPQYDPGTNDHDVGLVTLSPSTPLWPDDQNPTNNASTSIAPIDPISDPDFQTDLNTTGTTPVTTTVSGWGYDQPLGPTEDPDPSNFPNQLQAVDVPLIDQTTCENDFANEPFVTQIAGLTLFCAGDDSDETNVNNEDSCSGDSGGPIVIDPNQTAPHTDVQLAGLVDSGFGCAQAHLPGIYTRISDPSIQTFLASDPPGAPRQLSSVSIAGGNQPGQTLTCHSDPWTDPDATLAYQFFTTSGSSLTSPSAEGTTYTIQQGDLGKRIQCEVEATNAGGYGFAHSSSVLVAAPAPPVTPPGAVDSVAPRLRVTSKSCSQTACTIRVKVTDAAPSSGIAKVKARLNYARKVSCRKHGKKTTCTKRAHRTLRPRRGKGGKFTIVAKRLKPGTGYSVSLVPFDKAGNKPEFSTITSIRTKPRHRRGSLF